MLTTFRNESHVNGTNPVSSQIFHQDASYATEYKDMHLMLKQYCPVEDVFKVNLVVAYKNCSYIGLGILLWDYEVIVAVAKCMRLQGCIHSLWLWSLASCCVQALQFCQFPQLKLHMSFSDHCSIISNSVNFIGIANFTYNHFLSHHLVIKRIVDSTSP